MLVAGIAGVLGALVVGPLVNAAVLRWIGWRVTLPLLFGVVPTRAALGPARSTAPRCRRCGAALAPGGLPALPWLAVAGRCRACREPIGRWAGAVEVATGVLFALAGWRFGASWALAPVLVLFTGLVAISAVDLAHSRIPTRFVYLTGLGVVVAALPRWVDVTGSWTGAAVGAALGLGLLGVMHLAAPQMLGFGDVRLGALLGLAVGWVGWTAAEPILDPLSLVMQALFLAGIAGSLVGLALLVLRRTNQAYPFGPCLALGAVVTILAAT